MDKPALKDAMRLFADFGNIKSRSMFGGFGLFCEDTMFALVVNNTLHLRAGKENEALLKQQGLAPYVYKKRGFPVVTKYFAIPDAWWDNQQKLISEAKSALDVAIRDRSLKTETSPSRLKDLPNLRLATERMLKKAGIDSPESLHQQGAVNAYKALVSAHDKDLSLELLWSLEGAITGKHWSVVPPQRRQELLQHLEK
ncbi:MULTISPECIES: TfoX/Sxy family DNA transformation protein [unclassified Salinivibrio]|uniref:TfoX/Sxy family DNA transformation protein n=1 Tax=unclassified Salinivibrio TaxID=2636825 RepID=UPI00128BCB47|nr:MULTISPECIES: TfoX/Sxy family DNA transformation protein [unclassified Salinivibrio]MPS31700.1 TfoX/Sxy family DNA transformation protein [Salinivibrio sp. VYel7]MPX90271.1 TfoX/Sxy family DNA transformation protein [Salinivibrio sp. VYel1]MPX93095.1 TfoX/Sxy family DNA transformation protein [Salinivibrio sp. VYel9]MPX95221.1 TfoX/Sxy family DNA transformation protein [Salinivibrio sp. VYel6]MPX99313.1 TfoX/Sxy family DNA transformation protein [Salinivibrio sp. VYel4]